MHVFNDVIWPDFTRLPEPAQPVLRLQAVEVGQVLALGARRVEVLPACHTVPACGCAVLGRRGAWVFTGDTGPNAAFWQRLRDLPVATLVIETAFRDDERALAERSQHLCPAQLQHELAQLAAPADVFITHIKPDAVDAVRAEIGAGRNSSDLRLHALTTGQVMSLADRAPRPRVPWSCETRPSSRLVVA